MRYPTYLNFDIKELGKRANTALWMLKKCHVCPKNCKTNRLKDERNGFCRLGRFASVAAYHPHFGEERPLVGHGGSGTIFFAHCNLACVYCQNFDVSQLDKGDEVSPQALAEIMITLQNRGCENINFVTPTPNVPQILEALPIAIQQGLNLPLVYNTSCYDSVESLKLLEGIIDIYMPDLKYSDSQIAQKYSVAPRYFEIAKEAIKEMHRQVGDLQFDREGIAYRGLLIRHLILPGDLAGSRQIMQFISKEISPNSYVNVMRQYYPYFRAQKYPELARRITPREFNETLQLARQEGLKRIYY